MRPRILVVEDHQGQRKIYTLLLNLEGYEVITASDGRKGYRKAKARRPDLIFTDISMPIMGGDEMTMRLRKKKRFRTTPIVAVTAHDLGGAEAAAALAAGVNHVIDKSVSFDFLLDLIRQLIV